MDDERARLSADLSAAQTAKSQSEIELASVVRQWEEDGKRWATERKRLTDRVESLMSNIGSGDAGKASVASDRAEIEKLRRDQEIILKNWREETEMLVIAWQEDKRSWLAEREASRVGIACRRDSVVVCTR
jgi:hypothetical protein